MKSPFALTSRNTTKILKADIMSMTFASARVIAPAIALSNHHLLIQQHVAAIAQESDVRSKRAVIALKKADLKRVFGEDVPKEFYLFNGQHTTYVALRTESNGADRFGVAFALSNEILKVIVQDDQPSLALAGMFLGTLPQLRFVLLESEGYLEQSKLKDHLKVLSQEEYAKAIAESKFDAPGIAWVPNHDPVEEEEKRLNLKDIPLTTRANRRLVRDILEKNSVSLLHAWQTYLTNNKSEYSYFDWLTEQQGVYISVLNELQKLDELPDDQYVEAMIAFQKGDAQARHSQAVKDGKTELHLFDWVKENYQIEFNDLGRDMAMKDIEGVTAQQEPAGAEEAGEAIDSNSAVFVVTFDGTVVEDNSPAIGPATPFAIAVLKALVKNGHAVILHTDRDEEDLTAVIEYLDKSDFTPHGVVNCISSSDTLNEAINGLRFLTPLEGTVLEGADEEDGIEFDYLIDHRHYGANLVTLSGMAGTLPTLYWGDMAGAMVEKGYLTEEDLEIIKQDTIEKTAVHGDVDPGEEQDK